MKKLNNLTNPILGLDGKPIMNQVGTSPKGTPILVAETIGKMMANVLARAPGGDLRAQAQAGAQPNDPVKMMMLAMRIHGEKAVDLEDADFELVKEAVDKDQLLTNLGKAVLLNALSGAKGKEGEKD